MEVKYLIFLILFQIQNKVYKVFLNNYLDFYFKSHKIEIKFIKYLNHSNLNFNR